MGASPPTRGISKLSSSRRSCRVMSRSRTSCTIGPRGDAMAVHRPATTSAVLPRSTLRHATSSANASVTTACRSGASNATCSNTPWMTVPTSAPPGMSANCRGTAPSRATPPERVRAGGRNGDILVGCQGPLRLAADGGLVVQRAGDARIRRPAPAHVEGAVEHRGLEVGRASGALLPARRGGLVDPLDRDARSQPTEGRFDGGVGARLRAVGAHDPLGVTIEEQSGQRRVLAVLCAGPPQNRLMARPGQRHVEEAQVLSPRSSSSIFWWRAKAFPSRPTSMVRTLPWSGSWNIGTWSSLPNGRPSHM